MRQKIPAVGAALIASAIFCWAAPVRAAGGNAGAIIGGFIGALLGEILGHRIAIQADQRAEAQLQHDRLTRDDETNLKMIATSLEEYAVDHNGAYPATLAGLVPTYMRAPAWIPGSDPAVQYTYELPASRPEWGHWDIVDNGAFDPTLDKLRALDNTICTHEKCKHIVYAESQGLVGAP